ncbi:MAG: hypothetical protein Q8S58_07480 [Bosea sp. (in: a-proteobacteria)]|uniref:hypothetical protein n=1 Tax=Bosea sp. (in: a-proteobacteria) TaxID=1871050 RepID=UPI0027329363|nr:hypothetical protein [Bosea sp. (in: a-proteobacteria)]MDP3254702.1 hypothetical protein [Bosea sp. (in: a-proteobacteria)]MDP3318955.1 hypothetical protein [Bosea sp. (in: a-proteobacteria)]
MAQPIHPAATPHVPSFITPPDATDILLVVAIVTVVGAVLAVGLIFLRLHTLPERMAHKAHKLQFEIVAVLGLLALFTHVHLFWVAGLLLALIEIPDVWNPLRRMAGSLEKIAGLAPGQGAELGDEAVEPASVAPAPDVIAHDPPPPPPEARPVPVGGPSHA